MQKHPNAVIQTAHEGAQALAGAHLEFEVGLKVYEVSEALAPLARGIVNERNKLVTRIGDPEHGIILPEGATPEQEAEYHRQMGEFQRQYGRLMELEQEVPALPSIRVRLDEMRGIRLTGHQIGALRSIGALEIVQDES